MIQEDDVETTLRIQKGMENLTDRQLDTIYGLQYSYYLEVGRCNAGLYGVVNFEGYQSLQFMYNDIIGLVHKNHIN